MNERRSNMTTKEAKNRESTQSGKEGATSAPVSAPKAQDGHTLAELSGGYLAHLEAKGTSIMTRASYAADLAVAIKALGEKTRISTLTARKVGNYFESDAVVKTRTGKAKAMPTVLKTRRVLRLALVWAQEQGWIDEAPVPEAYQRRKGKKKEG